MKIFIGIVLLLIISAVSGASITYIILKSQVFELEKEIKKLENELEKYKPRKRKEEWKIVAYDTMTGDYNPAWIPVYYFDYDTAVKDCKNLNDPKFSDKWKLGPFFVEQA